MWIQFLGQDNPLEEGKATPSSILAWRIPWIEEPGGLQSIGSQKSRKSSKTTLSLLLCLLSTNHYLHLTIHTYLQIF